MFLLYSNNMTGSSKLIQKLKAMPKTFKWKDLEKILNSLNFEKLEGSGSRVKFINRENGLVISLHKPHPRPELKAYQVKQVVEQLIFEGLI